MVNQNALNRSVSKNRTNMQRVNILANNEIRSVFSVGREMTFNEQAILVRTATPVILNKYGQLASNVAANHYTEYRNLTKTDLDLPNYVARPQTLDDFNERISKTMDITIGKTISSSFPTAEALFLNMATGILSDYNRSTIRYNSENDTAQVVKIQRVAGPDACAFCAQMAIVSEGFEGIVYNENIVSYETDYHDHCTCTSEVIYEGQPTLRPSHYDEYQDLYETAYNKLSADGSFAADEAGTTRSNDFLKANPQYSITAKNINAYMRELGGLK